MKLSSLARCVSSLLLPLLGSPPSTAAQAPGGQPLRWIILGTNGGPVVKPLSAFK